MTEFNSLVLDDALETLLDYRGKSPPKSLTGIPVISAKVVKAGRITRPIEQTIAPDYYPTWMVRGLPQIGDVVMTTEGPMGEVAQLDEETVNFALGQRIVVLRGRPNILDNTFLKYLLMSPVQQGVLHSYATGTTVAGVSQKALRSVPIVVPAFGVQVQIGQILGALDDKIELNRRMNETLEAMARAIFKDWFVDFGPTRAKMERRKPYLAPDLWSLFPDRLNDKGLPEGWEMRDLGSMTSELRRGISPSYVSSGGVCVLNQKCIRDRHVSLAQSRRHDPSKRSIEGRELESGDVLVNSTGVGTLGRVAQIWHIDQKAVVDSHVTVIRADTTKLSKFVLGTDLTGREGEIEALGEGSTGQTELSRLRLAALEILYPDQRCQKAFDQCAAPMVRRTTTNLQENLTLAALRDLLLPKLMSGEIRVRDAEKLVREAV